MSPGDCRLNWQWIPLVGLEIEAPDHSTIPAKPMRPATIAWPNGRGSFPVLWTSIRSRVRHAGWIVSACLALAGCVYVPPIGEQDATRIDLAGFAVGSTSRDEVMSVLGDPLIDDGRFILDELYSSDGGIFWFAYALAYLPIGAEHTRLLLEFDEADVLERMDVEKGGFALNEYDVVPDERPSQDLEPLGELLPFDHVSWLRGAPMFHAAAFSPNGDLVAASDSSGHIFLIDFVSRTIERISPEGFDPDGWVFSVAFSPDGNSLAVQSRTIRIIDLKTREQTLVFDGHGNASFWKTKGALAMAYAPSGTEIVSGGTAGKVKIWQADTGDEVASWVGHEALINGIAVSSDGAMLATSGGDGFVRLWDRKTGAELGAIERWGKPAFSEDGELLAIASMDHVELWRLDRDSSDRLQGQALFLDGPMDMVILPYYSRDRWFFPITSSFTPGGERLLHSLGPTAIWDWTQRRLTPLPIPVGETFLAFGPDGRTMATSGADGVRLWRLPVVETD